MRALIIGCGYLGRRVAVLWTASGHHVSALTRSADNAAILKDAGVQPFLGDVLEPDSLSQLPESDTLLYAVGYDRGAPGSKRDVYVTGLDNVLAAVARRVGRVIYVSSTSVYGHEDGSWIDEDSPTIPATEGGRICLEAEGRFWSRVADGRPAADTTILRLAGLYGPDRLIGRLDQLRSGDSVAGNPETWLNLIHVDDAARCVDAVARGRAKRPLYLAADDEPVRRRAFYAELARRTGAPEPEFDPDGAGRVPGLGKRCRNARLHRDLVERLDFPDYRAGLASALAPSALAPRDSQPATRTQPR